MLGLLVAAGQPVGAQTPSYSIGVGQFFGVGANCDQATGQGCTGAESMRFFSGGTMKVHRGDTINFHSEGFHTATLLPKNTDVARWIEQNSPAVGGPWSLESVDADEDFKGNNQAIFPSHTDCGTATDPCSYDGSEVVNSGVFVFGDPAGMTVTVDAAPGDFFWVFCIVHPHMRMRVEVVAPAEAATTQADIDAKTASQLALDEDWASSTDARLKAKQTKHTTPAGKTVWDAFVGYDNHWTSLYAMYPKKINITKGQSVEFHFNQLIYEDHTATFPLATGLEIANTEFFVPNCDPDGDAGTAADNPPEVQGPPFCNDPSQLEFDVSDRAQLTTGDGIFRTSNDYENSGIRGAVTQPNTSWDVRFPNTSGDKGYKYICMIHPFMRGQVVVRQ